jgi:hypothetical protein
MNTTIKRDNLFLAVLLATILSAGAWVAWMILCFVTATLITQALSDPHAHTTLSLTVEGEPLLQTWEMPRYIKRVTRTLDGRLIEDADAIVAQRMYYGELAGPNERPVYAARWATRIRGFLRTQPSLTYWYLVRPTPAVGNAYFAGFDPASRRSIGYLGLKGFTSEIPAGDDQFLLSHVWNSSGEFAPNSNATFGTEPVSEPRDGGAALFVVSDGSLYRIDFRRQTVSPVDLPARVVSVATVAEPTLVADDRRATFKDRVAVRMPDQIALLDTDGKILRSIAIPAELAGASFALYSTVGEQWLAVQNQGGAWYLPTDIYWFDAAGKISRREQVDLSPGAAVDPRREAWTLATVFPMPLPLAIGSYIIKPYSNQWTNYKLASLTGDAEQLDFRTALAQSVRHSWLPFLLVCLLSAAAAAICYRHQRRVGGGHPIAWALFVFLTGLPGLAGYWLHCVWPPRERCVQCGASAPADRAQCLSCAAEFPQPALVGSEILA